VDRLQWQALPKDLPPESTVHDYLELWNWDGTLERIHHALYVAVREQEGREASPTMAIIDSQTSKGVADPPVHPLSFFRPARREWSPMIEPFLEPKIPGCPAPAPILLDSQRK
jgi:hypothetical protein